MTRERADSLGHMLIASGPGAGTSFQLGAVTDIGRARTGNQIVLEDKFVGRQHGRIRFEDGKFVYYDLGSANGSWVVNDRGARRPVRGPVALQDGDQLEIGEQRLVFRELERER
jgi:pSer/pThr/pTyr-binding forkhead associated (FHA) protein